jgi:NCAIR mutase (PurE)-related protein
MDTRKLRELLERVREGAVAPIDALEALKSLPYGDLGYARVDHHRALRQGIPEVIFGEGKTAEQIAGIAREQLRVGHNVLVTRVAKEKGAALLELVPELRFSEVARVASFAHAPIPPRTDEPVLVVSAGTSDLPVAEEALETLAMLGLPAKRIYDVGVAGLHRLAAVQDELRRAPAIIVVAGMEGALASVVGGLVAAPVVAVPTSIGYGVALGGITTLFGMLTGCAAGVTVVNIDNGFGAAMAVSRFITVLSRSTPEEKVNP